jgi:hypothetical protein
MSSNKRNVEHGVISTSKKKFKKKELIRETSAEKEYSVRRQPQIIMYDFSLEEEKDQNDIKNFINTYKKLLHFLFKTYANSGFSHKNINSFDAMQNRLETMSLAEAILMLKKNSIIPELLHKEEAATILRLVNAHIMGDKREGKALTFDAFNSYFLQIAMFVFGRAPINLSQKPPIESVKALLKLFEKSALQRGENIKLFENPDYTIIADNDVIKELNKALKRNPEIPMPDGFKKVKIKDYKSEYKVPEYMQIPEKNKICLEIMDEILSKAFGFHLFEPINKPVYTYKAKPILKQLMKFPVIKKDVPYVLKNSNLPPKGKGKKSKFLDPIPTNPHKPDRSAERTTRNQNRNKSMTKRSKVNHSMPAHRYGETSEAETSQRKRVYNEVTPELGLNLRLEVIKYPMHIRDYVQEVAETLEEVLDAASKGLDKLPPRKKYGLHTFMNKAQRLKVQKEENSIKNKVKREQEYEQHRVELHEQLRKMKEEKKKAFQEVKQKNLEKKRKQKDKKMKQKQETVTEREKIKKEIDQKRAQEMQEKMKKDEMKQKIQQELEKRKKDNRKEFFNKRKSQMRKEFKTISKQRNGALTEEEKADRETLVKKQKNKNLKQYFDQQKELKEQNEAAKNNYLQFYESPELQKVLDDNFESISESYLKFSKEQKYTTKTQPNDFKMNFGAFKKFGHDMKIYPNVVSFEDFSHVFKMI